MPGVCLKKLQPLAEQRGGGAKEARGVKLLVTVDGPPATQTSAAAAGSARPQAARPTRRPPRWPWGQPSTFCASGGRREEAAWTASRPTAPCPCPTCPSKMHRAATRLLQPLPQPPGQPCPRGHASQGPRKLGPQGHPAT